jgi:hypothetical protein
MPKETCVSCGKETHEEITTHVDFRTCYVEGMGQFCVSCYNKSNQSDREMIMLPKHYIKSYPNNYELGERVRQFYYSEYGNNEPKAETQWTCQFCGEDTSRVDYDYLSGTDHISCILATEMKS